MKVEKGKVRAPEIGRTWLNSSPLSFRQLRGRVVLELIAGPQHRHGGGVVQGGVITQIADAAMGMSLATLQEDGIWNTTIELKINFIRPVVSGKIRAVGRVVEMRQTLLFSEADVLDEKDRLVARASSTCMPVPEGQGRE